MRKILIAAVMIIAGLSASYARGGMHGSGMHGAAGMYGGGMYGSGMYGSGTHALMAPANPSVPPSLTPDPRLTGIAPLPSQHQFTPGNVASRPDALKPDPEEVAVDRAIGNICRGC